MFSFYILGINAFRDRDGISLYRPVNEYFALGFLHELSRFTELTGSFKSDRPFLRNYLENERRIRGYHNVQILAELRSVFCLL